MKRNKPSKLEGEMAQLTTDPDREGLPPELSTHSKFGVGIT
ncbi:hypothetical protein A2U01_0110575, partial [Trifolium medium]|nr:hypothetical protein [Trifolium medium]